MNDELKKRLWQLVDAVLHDRDLGSAHWPDRWDDVHKILSLLASGTWVMVPAELRDEMHDHLLSILDREVGTWSGYEDMLAAAPNPLKE